VASRNPTESASKLRFQTYFPLGKFMPLARLKHSAVFSPGTLMHCLSSVSMADPNVFSSWAISCACCCVGIGTSLCGAALPEDSGEDDGIVGWAFGDALLAARAGTAQKKSAKAAVVDFENCILAICGVI